MSSNKSRKRTSQAKAAIDASLTASLEQAEMTELREAFEKQKKEVLAEVNATPDSKEKFASDCVLDFAVHAVHDQLDDILAELRSHAGNCEHRKTVIRILDQINFSLGPIMEDLAIRRNDEDGAAVIALAEQRYVAKLIHRKLMADNLNVN